MTTPHTTDPTDTLAATDLLDENGTIDVSKVKSLSIATHVTPHNSKVTPELCATLREELAETRDTDAVTDTHDIGKTTLADHAEGECSHDIDTPPVVYGWVRAPDADDSGGNENYGHVSRAKCQRIRRLLLSGVDRSDVAERVDMDMEYVSKHARGECVHHSHSNDLGPLRYGWGVRPEERE